MSYAAYKMMHWPTSIENCAAGYITHSPADFPLPIIPPSTVSDSDWLSTNPSASAIGPVPNLVVSAGNVLEVYVVRVQEGSVASDRKRGGVMGGVSGVALELVCHYRLHGNVESLGILSASGSRSRKRDSVILAFRDAKISVLEYDDSIHALRT
ncbi:Cleavage and polyadenylation specificity factor subunit 1-like protein, partial [Drosera capensis]